MLSNKSKDNERVKMREEAKKKRAQIARAAKLPHVQRNESKFGDLGFVSVKVDPDSDDAWSICLKNGLIDYRELLCSFPTREDYRYLGIDNVPGTPEVNLCATDDSFRFPRQIPRVNGFKNGIVKDNSSSLTHPSKNSEKEDVPNSDVTDKDSKRSSKEGPSQEISNQENLLAKKRSGEEMGGLNSSLVMRVKDEPMSPKVVPDNATNEEAPPSAQSNEDAEARRRASSQPKAKPPVLKMPDASKPAMNTSDKTQRTHPSKIESILKEMTEILPPLTDIQTPVKSQDTRFPFPQPPPSKENSNHMLQSDKQSNAAKSDENWTNDFITSSDDESDREHEGITKPEAVLGASNQRLSASSSSSSDASSSESSSDSESSDSETESSSGRKAMKTPSLMFNSEPGNTLNSSTPHSQGRSVPSLNAPVKKAQRGKVMCGEFLERQVSPLNSITKEVKRDVEISPFANDLTDIESDIKDSILLSETHLDPESPLQPEPRIDFTSVDPATDIETSMERTDTPFKGKINPSNHFRSDNELTMNAELTDPSSFADDIMDRFIFDPDFPNTGQVDDFADIMNIGKSPFGPNFPIIAMEAETPSVPTVNIDSLNFASADVDSSSSVGIDRSRGGKRPAASIVANNNIDRSDADRLGNSSLNSFGKNSSSTPLQGKPQSKKDIEQEWFRKIISPTKKNFDLPYVIPKN
ncbi:uncharacterized protein LOC135685981 [Rhopilema esculentum]|uniref:uncharacterized protein LOC135685981 n=1 Tax=Rhopilema esculentum TaxID=499914 RepID=UPI0031DC740C